MTEFRFQGSVFRVQGLGFQGLGFRRSHSDNPGEACGSKSDE